MSEKTMNEEMNDEVFDLAVQNIHKLIPEEWMPRINEILPKILNIVKIGINKNIKTTAEGLGDTKMMICMNFPHSLQDGSTMMVPTMFKIDKNQIGRSMWSIKVTNKEGASVFLPANNSFAASDKVIPFGKVLEVIGSATYSGYSLHQIAEGWILDADVQAGNYEFGLKDGAVPEVTFSMLTLAQKLNSYKSIETLIKDLKDGNFITLKDMGYAGDQKQVLTTEQKQIEQPK